MKKIWKLALSVCLMGMLMSGCLKENLGVGNRVQPEEEGVAKWNKNKTIELYFVSELADKGVSEFPQLWNYVKGKGDAWTIGVVDRCDVMYNPPRKNTNAFAYTSFATGKFASYALNRYAGGNTQGSTILFNHKMNNEEFYPVSSDCFVKFIRIQTKTTTENPVEIIVPFATARFETVAHIEAAKTAFDKISAPTHQAMMVGTVKADVAEKLKSAVEALTGYAYTEATKSNDYVLFMAAPKSWVLRETTKDLIGKNLAAFCLSIEASVE